MSESRFDHIVIGAGALGSAAAYWLSARSGSGRVLLCEQFHPGHPWGSSDDHSRIIRHAYHSPVYTALTPSAYSTWAEVEERSGARLVVRTGGLDLACEDTPGHALLATYRTSLDVAGIPYERLDADMIRACWPQWTVTPETTGIYQADGGLVDIRRATAAHLRLALEQGVTVLDNCHVQEARSLQRGVEIRTDAGVFSAGSLIVCAGSWAGPLLTKLGCPFTITLTQEQVQYFTAPDLDLFHPDRFPIWVWHGDHDLYGFPVYGEPAVKAARDMTGRFVTPETRSFVPDPAETEYVRSFLQQGLPAAAGPVRLAKTCVYDLPRDRDLVTGPMPEHPRVFIAIGAGHAGKFASLIGAILADLATEGRTGYPIAAFRPDRPSLAPTAPPRYRLGDGPAAATAAADPRNECHGGIMNSSDNRGTAPRRLSRRTFLRSAASASLLAGGAAGLAACGRHDAAAIAAPSKPRYGGQLRIGMVGAGNQESLNPSAASYTLINLAMTTAVFNSLIDVTPGMDLAPALATSWTANQSSTEWTFDLRPGVT